MTLRAFIGTRPTFTATFKVAGVNIDPTTVTLKVRNPNRQVTNYTGADITRTAQGIYSAAPVVLDQPGDWSIKWVGTGSCAAASADIQINVPVSVFT